MGFTVNASDFNRATKVLQQSVRNNVQTYGSTLAATFEQQAKGGAPWVDRRGNARAHLFGTMTASGNRVRVDMGGSAPNYKRGPKSSPDYLEYLEFDHGGRFSIVMPTAEAIFDDVRQNFGEAALYGKSRPGMRIQRDRLAAKERRRRKRLGLERDRFDLRGANGRFIKNDVIG